MDFAEYAKINAVNWSTLKEMRRSPLHYRHRAEHAKEDTSRLALGRAVHTAVFEPDRFRLDYACFDGERRAGKLWTAFQEAHPGRTILKREEYETAIAMKTAVRSHPIAGPLLTPPGEAEKVITWTDEPTGLRCKARLDWWRIGLLCDLKTTGDVDARRFGALAARMGYHGQTAFYSQGLRANHLDAPPPRIVAVEVEPPHDVAVFVVGEDALYVGELEVAELLAKVSAGRFSGQWPGRYPGEEALHLPRWMFGGADDNATALDLEVSGQEAEV